ncbi:hypothetical protein ACSBR2_035762 [Camellia fascicularis]
MGARRSLALRSLISAIVLLLLTYNACSFYLPGVAPQDFDKGDKNIVRNNFSISSASQREHINEAPLRGRRHTKE